MAHISDIHKGWLKERKYKKAYEALEEELAAAVIDVGIVRAYARRTGPEDGHNAARGCPAGKRTLERLAHATGTRLLIGIELREAKRP